ncbi:MAG: adenosine deaminase [Spirochaetaceae bacterium]
MKGFKVAGSQRITDEATLRAFPKVELHRHLEGTFELNTLHKMAMRNGLDLPEDMGEFKKAVQFPKDSEPDFLKFLSKFRVDWYRTLDDVYDITHASVLDMVNDGIFYIELRFSPEHFALQNDFDRRIITKLVIRAANEAAAEAGIYLRFLITFNRMKQTPKEMIDLYEEVKSLKQDEIVGVDLAGDETNYPPEDFVEFFDHVRKDGIYKATIHAGEVTPSQQIWTSIRDLHARRIGHGTSSIDDPKLQQVLKDEGIVLEQCITSNYQTGSWADEKNHPLGRLFRNGVPVTINSDDPTIQDTDLSEDYVKAVNYFDLTVDDLERLNMIAIDGAFVTETEKIDLKNRYRRRLKEVSEIPAS